jgi:diguanylate cyclase (GGDEF)-like protein
MHWASIAPRIGGSMERPSRWFSFTDIRSIALLVILIFFLAGGGIVLGQLISARMLRQDALSTSRTWVNSLIQNADDLPAVIAGKSPSNRTQQLLNGATQVGDVYRFRIWDMTGHMAFASDRIASAPASNTLASLYGKPLAAKILSGSELTEARSGANTGDPAYFAVSYLPIVKNGSRLGTFEIYLDQTADKVLYEHSFFLTEIVIALGVLIAGAIPGVMVYRKMLEHRAAEAEALFLAEHDTLTSVPNRRGLEQRAPGALALARRNKTHSAILLVDLDRFKQVNDSFGHAAGDDLLRMFAERLRRTIRTEDIVARLGGDEFVVLQVGLAQPAGALSLAQRLTSALEQSYILAGVEVACGASIGIAIAPTDAGDWDPLLTCADAAMCKAKSEGGNTACFFQSGMDAVLRDRRRIELDIRRALDTNAFRLAFQPLLSFRDRQVVGFEALLRWPEGWSSQSPASFIPVAEECGLMVPLGAWVLETACRYAAGWSRPLKIAVNLSPMQFRHSDAVSIVRGALLKSGLEPERLELEVTEGIWLQNTDAVLDQLAQLRAMGVSIALDDFGTGYSSLAYLWKFPFDSIKIDRSFVSEMQEEPKAAAIVQTVLALAKSLQLVVTAEGVETEAQAHSLTNAGCDLAQGYLFGRPMEPGAATALIDADWGTASQRHIRDGASVALLPVSTRG